jgi:uncharacterized protein YggE
MSPKRSIGRLQGNCSTSRVSARWMMPSAKRCAEAVGIQLGGIINLQEESTGQQLRPPVARSGAMESAGPAPVPVEAGEVVLRARVRITWRIAN